jgi:pimeloyl-ACP methyl ester carboxylesterase
MSTQLSPDVAALQFLTPARPSMQDPSNSGPKPDRMWSTPGGAIATWYEGDGRTVLLVHGWSGKHTDMDAFIAPLVAAGCKVVSMDLLAHGESEGEIASIPDLAESILAVANAIGPVHGVIAHSIGCAATALALKKGMQALRAVLVAPPARYAHFARAFSMHVGVDPDAMLDALRRMDIDVDSIDLPLMAPKLRASALVIHSTDDQVVPFANGKAIAAAWPGARLLEYDGLGHKKILFDPTVIAAAVSFLIE